MASAFHYLKAKDPAFVNKILESRQFHDLMEAYKKAFWWKPGKYTVEFRLGSPKKLKLEQVGFSFSLSGYDVDALRQNLDAMEADCVGIIKTNLPDYKQPLINWVWRNLPLSKSKDLVVRK